MWNIPVQPRSASTIGIQSNMLCCCWRQQHCDRQRLCLCSCIKHDKATAIAAWFRSIGPTCSRPTSWSVLYTQCCWRQSHQWTWHKPPASISWSHVANIDIWYSDSQETIIQQEKFKCFTELSWFPTVKHSNSALSVHCWVDQVSVKYMSSGLARSVLTWKRRECSFVTAVNKYSFRHFI